MSALGPLLGRDGGLQSAKTGPSLPPPNMRVGDNLPPLLQHIANLLWVAGLGLCFVTAISGLWGWHVVGALQCVVLVVLVASEKENLRRVLNGSLGGAAARAFAWYQLSLASVAVVVNLILLIRWAVHS